VKNQDTHLNEDQIIRAVVDEDDLTASERNHLLQCFTCQREKRAFEQVLNRLGEMSEELLPSPRRRFAPDAQENRSLWRWRPALAVGFVIVLLMIGIWWTSFFTRVQENGSMHITQKMESDQQFMAESTFIEDYALPNRYIDIIDNSNNGDYDDYYYDDEFLEFVLPL